jgi:hypothetical protein
LRRCVIQFVSAVGVLVALAIFDLGPRAGAAFLTMAGKAAPAELGATAPADGAPDAAPERQPGGDHDRLPAPAVHLQGGGSMTPPSGSGPSAGSPPVAGELPRTELPSGGLVLTYREPAAAFDLSAFIDSILDPPRPA